LTVNVEAKVKEQIILDSSVTEHNFLSDSEFLYASFLGISFYPLFFFFLYKRFGGKPFNLRSFYFPKEKVFVEVEKVENRTQKY
uniref:hypothetical protein n=1 Tax=Parasutterella sp. TaxID=2049037 RepID=UPI00307AE41A